MAEDEISADEKKLLELDDEAESNVARQILEPRMKEHEKVRYRSGEDNILNFFIILLIIAGICIAAALIFYLSQEWEIVIPEIPKF